MSCTWFGVASYFSILGRVRLWSMLQHTDGTNVFDILQTLFQKSLLTISSNLETNLIGKCLQFTYNRNYNKGTPPFIANAIKCDADMAVICKSPKNKLVSVEQPLRFPCISPNSGIRRKRQGKSCSKNKLLKNDCLTA